LRETEEKMRIAKASQIASQIASEMAVKQRNYELARLMKMDKLDKEIIKKYSGLTDEEIDKL
jgi:hypothetical protein